MIDFDITSESKEDGKTFDYHSPVEKVLVIKMLSERTGLQRGVILDRLRDGGTVSTAFHHYRRSK